MEEIYKNLSLENLENEIWRDVVGFEGLYEVSSLGRVKSLNYNHTKQEKILCQRKNKNGYLQLILCKDGKRKTCTVHRLVGNAFLENPNNLPCFNHKDENKTNNCVDNLEPCTHKYNLNYKNTQARRIASTDYKEISRKRVASTDYKAIVEKRKIDYKAIAAKMDYKAIAEKLSKKVFQYSKNGTLVAVWQSTRECGRNGFNQRNVSDCCRGKLPHYKGFIWSYQEL